MSYCYSVLLLFSLLLQGKGQDRKFEFNESEIVQISIGYQEDQFEGYITSPGYPNNYNTAGTSAIDLQDFPSHFQIIWYLNYIQYTLGCSYNIHYPPYQVLDEGNRHIPGSRVMTLNDSTYLWSVQTNYAGPSRVRLFLPNGLRNQPAFRVRYQVVRCGRFSYPACDSITYTPIATNTTNTTTSSSATVKSTNSVTCTTDGGLDGHTTEKSALTTETECSAQMLQYRIAIGVSVGVLGLLLSVAIAVGCRIIRRRDKKRKTQDSTSPANTSNSTVPVASTTPIGPQYSGGGYEHLSLKTDTKEEAYTIPYNLQSETRIVEESENINDGYVYELYDDVKVDQTPPGQSSGVQSSHYINMVPASR